MCIGSDIPGVRFNAVIHVVSMPRVGNSQQLGTDLHGGARKGE